MSPALAPFFFLFFFVLSFSLRVHAALHRCMDRIFRSNKNWNSSGVPRRPILSMRNYRTMWFVSRTGSTYFGTGGDGLSRFTSRACVDMMDVQRRSAKTFLGEAEIHSFNDRTMSRNKFGRGRGGTCGGRRFWGPHFVTGAGSEWPERGKSSRSAGPGRCARAVLVQEQPPWGRMRGRARASPFKHVLRTGGAAFYPDPRESIFPTRTITRWFRALRLAIFREALAGGTDPLSSRITVFELPLTHYPGSRSFCSSKTACHPVLHGRGWAR